MDQTAAVDALLQIANNEDSKQSTDSSVSSSAKAGFTIIGHVLIL